MTIIPQYIDQAFILAAGNATRMRPLSDHKPKPLINLCNKPLLTHILDHLRHAGVQRVVINGHHCLPVLEEYIQHVQNTYTDINIILSAETELLETGGGSVQAMQYLNKDNPFFMINGDAFWVNGSEGCTLSNLAEQWDPDVMDMLLLLQDTQTMPSGMGVGDYSLDQDGKATRIHDKNGDYMFGGVRIVKPSVITPHPLEKFSFLRMMDTCESNKTLYGHRHKGQWYHLSTPEDIPLVEGLLKQQEA